MNISYAGLKLEDYSLEVQKKYQFPSADEIERFKRQEQVIGREELRSSLRLAHQDFFVVAGSLTLGSLSYIFYNLPAGKVIRDRVRASMPYPKRFLVQVLPFVALSTAFFVSRKGIENKHKYRQ